jgi:hypothetical protein
MSIPKAISKTLSANDVGATGAHQAGMLIPKDPQVLGFFPALERTSKNPRVHLQFIDDTNKEWEFAFIYYNNKYHDPLGTRDEYRLTRMTRYIVQNALRVGDEITLYIDKEDNYRIAYQRASSARLLREGTLRLSSTWHVVSI